MRVCYEGSGSGRSRRNAFRYERPEPAGCTGTSVPGCPHGEAAILPVHVPDNDARQLPLVMSYGYLNDKEMVPGRTFMWFSDHTEFTEGTWSLKEWKKVVEEELASHFDLSRIE